MVEHRGIFSAVRRSVQAVPGTHTERWGLGRLGKTNHVLRGTTDATIGAKGNTSPPWPDSPVFPEMPEKRIIIKLLIFKWWLKIFRNTR